MESPPVRALRSVNGERVALHLTTRDEYHRAFPLFFRAIAHEACGRLWERFPDAAAFVGEDCRREATTRYPHLARLNLDWVAFAFRGKLSLNDASVIGEIQLVEPARSLTLSDLAGEVSHLAASAVRYYEIVAPLPAAAGIVPRT